jgi:fumarylpyruvate hydrolase
MRSTLGLINFTSKRAFSTKTMIKYVFPPSQIPSLAIVESSQNPSVGDSTSSSSSPPGLFFPVRRVYCVGRNYADHAREMGGDPDREPPFFFGKPADAVVPSGLSDDSSIPYPLATKNLHYEIELVVAIGRSGVKIAQADALSYVFGYAVGIDLTRRDLQQAAKDRRGPWDSAKGFDQSAPIGPISPASTVGHLSDSSIWLTVNGEKRQAGNLQQMTWTVPEVISMLSNEFHLQPGDLILTGTPSGVGPIVAGDTVRGGIDGLEEVTVKIVEEAV